MICDSSACHINKGGCTDLVSGQVALENGTNGSCGDIVSAEQGCVAYACYGCNDSTTDFDACAQHSIQSECKSYADAAANAATCTSIDAGASVCSPQSDADYAAFVNVFCGSGP
jgi:hypothetical protein